MDSISTEVGSLLSRQASIASWQAIISFHQTFILAPILSWWASIWGIISSWMASVSFGGYPSRRWEYFEEHQNFSLLASIQASILYHGLQPCHHSFFHFLYIGVHFCLDTVHLGQQVFHFCSMVV
jgi:hypothetical protein